MKKPIPKVPVDKIIVVDRVEVPIGSTEPEHPFITIFKSIPGHGTTACETFFIEYFRETHVLNGGKVVTRLRRFSDPEFTPEGSLTPEIGLLIDELLELANDPEQEYLQISRAIMISRQVDNYLAYLTELIAIVLRTRPETLRSSKTVAVEEVLKFASIEEFTKDQVESELASLAHKGYLEIKKYFEKFGLKLTKDQKDEKYLIQAIEDRNLFTHRRGIIDQKYLDRLSAARIDTSLLTLGTHLVDSANYPPSEILTETIKSVVWLDHNAFKKFQLEQVDIGLFIMRKANPNWMELPRDSGETDADLSTS